MGNGTRILFWCGILSGLAGFGFFLYSIFELNDAEKHLNEVIDMAKKMNMDPREILIERIKSEQELVRTGKLVRLK